MADGGLVDGLRCGGAGVSALAGVITAYPVRVGRASPAVVAAIVTSERCVGALCRRWRWCALQRGVGLPGGGSGGLAATINAVVVALNPLSLGLAVAARDMATVAVGERGGGEKCQEEAKKREKRSETPR